MGLLEGNQLDKYQLFTIWKSFCFVFEYVHVQVEVFYMSFNFIIIILVIKGSNDKRSEFSIQTPLRASNRMRGKVLTKWLLSSSY